MTDNPPQAIARAGLFFTFRGSADAAATVNVDINAASDGITVDGLILRNGDEFLCSAQTAPSQNGVYLLAATGSEGASGSFNGTGQISLTGQTQTRGFYWVKGNGTSIVGTTTLTDTGVVKPDASGNLVINGPPNTPNTGSLKAVVANRSAPLNTSAEFQNGVMVRVTGGTANSGTWQYTGISNPTLGTTALPFTKVSTSASGAVSPPVAPPTFTNTPPGALDPCAVPAA